MFIIINKPTEDAENPKQSRLILKQNTMKTLLIEKTTVGISECEVIMLHDQENKQSSYVYTSEVDYQHWVIEQAKAFRSNGYKIFNNTEIVLNKLN